MLPGFESLVHEPDVELVRGIAVDGTYIYWANEENAVTPVASIGRAKLDGSEIQRDFITIPGGGTGNRPFFVAVNGTHIYWLTEGLHQLGRAKLDGSESEVLLTISGDPLGLALSSTRVYWSWSLGVTHKNGIGRANLDGSSPEHNFLVITGEPSSFRYARLATDSTYLYFSYGNFAPDIGRCKLDGSEMNEHFIKVPASGEVPIKVVGSKLWYKDFSEAEASEVIYSINLDGTGNKEVFRQATECFDVAITATGRAYATHLGTPSGGLVLRSEVPAPPTGTSGLITAGTRKIGAVHG